MGEQRYRDWTSDLPACWGWVVPTGCETPAETMLWFHRGHCALCGIGQRRRLVHDCTVDTNVLRGYLCVGCDSTVHKDTRRAFVAYRACPPAALVSVRMGCWGNG